MNQHDDGRGQDHGWEDPAEADLLKQTFGAMAGGVNPGSPTGPAAVMSVMTKRVRRRRTAKLGGLGGGALALAGALVLGAGQLAPPNQAEVLPGGSSSAQVSTPDFEVKDGYQPPWLDWSDLSCGMPVADLKSTASGWSVESAGDIYTHTADLGGERTRTWGMPATYQEGEGTLDAPPVLVWSKDGVVLDLGPNVFEGWDGQSDPLLGAGGDAVLARGTSMTTCIPGSYGGNLQHETPLPEGDYEVRVVAFPQVAVGQWETAVSEPVPVRLDADGAHSPVEVRDDWVTMEYPEPHEGQVSRFEMERATGWVHAEMTQHNYSSDAEMKIIGYCVGSAMGTPLPIELVQPSTGKVLKTTQITCDGEETEAAVGVLSSTRSGEAVDIRIPEVPDDAMHFWVSLESQTPVGGGDAGPDCSATGYEPLYAGEGPSREASTATAGAILVAALGCDVDALVELADASGTELMPDGDTPERTFALPESGVQHYRVLATLLTGTSRAYGTGPEGNETIVWPRVATDEFADSDEAWEEVVVAGLLTADQAAAQRADGTYLGPRIGIAAGDGTWRYYSAGD
ncbi:hypothetical protein ACFT2C_13310 [Promicromonospora sp. NPDC057138]|uniref:hypothetical protein n=1 Tax=Promicromonospora sp. NPDC057138 TaxID=3346031 RepID=UPI00362C9DDE